MDQAQDKSIQAESVLELWERLLPWVRERVALASSLNQNSSTSPECLLEAAHAKFLTLTRKQRDFQSWQREVKNWKRWAHSLIPLRTLNSGELQEIWNRLYNPENSKCPVLVAVNKVYRKYLPDHYTEDEFFRDVVQHLSARFMRQYNTNYLGNGLDDPRLEAWLTKQAQSAALDVRKLVTEGAGLPTDIRPKGFVSIDERIRGHSDEKGYTLAEMLPTEPQLYSKNVELAEKLMDDHCGKSFFHELSGGLVYLCKVGGYDPQELGNLLELPAKNVRQIVREDLTDMLVTAERKFNIRR
jgi:hypothetical protein